ncbi:DUF4870 domain-containing protein [Microlunatus sp. GCM10028923]|uniref:DUF4870 domain-containing protein n=1 Tax=Microlunatus sp. GCM10028923 TaxID=3273400 RepID=UPI00361558EF
MSHDPRPGPGGAGPYSHGPQGPGEPGPEPFGTAPMPSLSQGDERLWATVAHLSIPVFGFVGPTIVWFAFAHRSAWLRETTAEALNFSILYTIAQVVSTLLIVILIGVLLVPLVGIAAVIVCILATMAVHRGEQYRYPVNLRIVR